MAEAERQVGMVVSQHAALARIALLVASDVEVEALACTMPVLGKENMSKRRTTSTLVLVGTTTCRDPGVISLA